VSLQLQHAGQLGAARDAVAALPQVAAVELDERGAKLTALPADGAGMLEAISERMAQAGVPVVSLRIEAGRLDEVFRNLTS
jgi:ABC-2 type transport system ATP-binding protein